MPYRSSGYVFGGEASFKELASNHYLISRMTQHIIHTIITDLYEETHGANIAAAVAWHSKTTITMNRYAHARQDVAAKGIKALDEVYSM